jgi:hypothetical protein
MAKPSSYRLFWEITTHALNYRACGQRFARQQGDAKYKFGESPNAERAWATVESWHPRRCDKIGQRKPRPAWCRKRIRAQIRPRSRSIHAAKGQLRVVSQGTGGMRRLKLKRAVTGLGPSPAHDTNTMRLRPYAPCSSSSRAGSAAA